MKSNKIQNSILSKRAFIGSIQRIIGYKILILLAFLSISNLVKADTLEIQRNETEIQLNHLRENLELSKQQQNELSNRLSELTRDQKNIKSNLIKITKSITLHEESLENNTDRIAQLKLQQQGVKSSLLKRRSLLSEVLAALQRMGKKPPPAILVQPKDALSSVRSAILLGAVVPEMRAETKILLADLTELKQLQVDILEQQEQAKLTLVDLHKENASLNVLLEEKTKISAQSKSLLDIEIAQSQKIIKEVKSLEKLIQLIERKIDDVNAATIAAQTEDQKRRQEELARLAQSKKLLAENTDEIFADTARIQPAIPFSNTKGLLPLPVNGVQIKEFGEKTQFDETLKGVLLSTRANTKVISPADGWVIYAGKFRSYGKVLILKLGSGYHLILAGMDKIHAQIGQFILRGEPIATMGKTTAKSTLVFDASSKRPVLYVELRKDHKAINPTPWWDQQYLKRVSNGS